MSEEPPKQPQKAEDDMRREMTPMERYVLLATKLAENGEHFPFSGLAPEAYSRIKAEEAEYPGYTTPIDELVERCKNEGMKVVLGKHPESGNVWILPAHSEDANQDAIAPRQLLINETIDERLKNLILMSRNNQ